MRRLLIVLSLALLWSCSTPTDRSVVVAPTLHAPTRVVHLDRLSELAFAVQTEIDSTGGAIEYFSQGEWVPDEATGCYGVHVIVRRPDGSSARFVWCSVYD